MKKILKKILRYFRRYRWQIFFAIVVAFLIFFIFLFLANLKNKKATVSLSPSPSPPPAYQDFHLLIPSLDINVPVIADVDGNNKKTYDKALENGVAQLLGSTKPGEGSNIFIFGHSSYYWWASGEYKSVFAKLPSIHEGDEIIVWYDSKEYKYRVSGLKTVLPDDVNVTDQTPSEQLSLMTCVPVGTDQKRLIVTAKPE